MAKRSVPEKNVAELMPDELNALKEVVKEFMNKIEFVDNEIETLKSDRKEICGEYSDRLDVRTLNLALKVIKIQNSVLHKNTYDLFLEALQDETN